MSVLLYILLIVLLVRVVSLSSRPRIGPPAPDDRDVQIRQLREEVDLLAADVRRLADEQAFMVRLLSEGEKRPDGLPAPPPSDPNPENP